MTTAMSNRKLALTRLKTMGRTLKMVFTGARQFWHKHGAGASLSSS
jgi:hypothetical protein